MLSSITPQARAMLYEEISDAIEQSIAFQNRSNAILDEIDQTPLHHSYESHRESLELSSARWHVKAVELFERAIMLSTVIPFKQ